MWVITSGTGQLRCCCPAATNPKSPSAGRSAKLQPVQAAVPAFAPHGTRCVRSDSAYHYQSITKKPHASAGTKSPASSEESPPITAAAKTAEKRRPAPWLALCRPLPAQKVAKRAYASDVRHFIQHSGAITGNTGHEWPNYLAKLARL